MQMKKLLGLTLLSMAMVGVVQAAPAQEVDVTRAAFEASLSAKSSDGFEGIAVGTTGVGPNGVANPFALPGLNGTASLSGTSRTFGPETNKVEITGRISDTLGDGRYNTTGGGSKWWETSLNFTVMFGTGVQAFGFNLVDYGDFSGQLSLDIYRADNSLITSINNLGHGSDSSNGSLQFVGIFDQAAEMHSVRFRVTQDPDVEDDYTAFDWLGFDDLLIGSRAPRSDVPEPGSLALVLISLLGLAAARRKARR